MTCANNRGLPARVAVCVIACGEWAGKCWSCTAGRPISWHCRRRETLVTLSTNDRPLFEPCLNTPFLRSSLSGRVSSTPSMALLLDVIARRQVATTPPLASDFLYHASFHSGTSSLSLRFFCCLRGRFTAAVSPKHQSGNHPHVTALKWRTGAAEIARLRDLPFTAAK